MFNQVCDVSRFKTPVGIPVYIFCIGNLYSHPESMPVYLQDSCHIGGWWPYQWPSCFNVKTLECSCWLVISTTLNSMLCIGDHYPILLKIMGHEMSWIIRFQTYIIWYNPICIYIIFIYIIYTLLYIGIIADESPIIRKLEISGPHLQAQVRNHPLQHGITGLRSSTIGLVAMSQAGLGTFILNTPKKPC